MAFDQFITEEEAARRLGICPHTLIAAMQRGEVPGVVRFGRSVRIFWPAVELAAFGIDVVVALAKQLGVKDLDGLVAFLSGSDTGGSDIDSAQQ